MAARRKSTSSNAYAVTLEALRADFRVFGEALNAVRADVGAVRSDMHQEFAFVKAAITQHDRVLAEHGRKLDDNGRKLDEHGRKLDEHGRKLDEHGRKLDEHGQRLGSHDSRFDRLEAKVDAIDKKLDRKVDRDEVVAIVEGVLDARR